MTPAGQIRGGREDPDPPSRSALSPSPGAGGRSVGLWVTSKNSPSPRRCRAAGTRPFSQVPSLCWARGVPTAAARPPAGFVTAGGSAPGSESLCRPREPGTGAEELDLDETKRSGPLASVTQPVAWG